jgi:hypothetical protein
MPLVDLDLAPVGVALEHVLVALGEGLAGDVLAHEAAISLADGQMSLR